MMVNIGYSAPLYKHTQSASPLVGMMGGDRCRGHCITREYSERRFIIRDLLRASKAREDEQFEACLSCIVTSERSELSSIDGHLYTRLDSNSSKIFKKRSTRTIFNFIF